MEIRGCVYQPEAPELLAPLPESSDHIFSHSAAFSALSLVSPPPDVPFPQEQGVTPCTPPPPSCERDSFATHAARITTISTPNCLSYAPHLEPPRCKELELPPPSASPPPSRMLDLPNGSTSGAHDVRGGGGNGRRRESYIGAECRRPGAV